MRISFFQIPTSGAGIPRYRRYKEVLTNKGHTILENDFNADLFILWSPINSTLLSTAIKIKRKKTPLIYDCYYSMVEAFVDEGRIKLNSKKEKRLRFLEGSMFQLSDLILVHSKSSQEYLANKYNVSVNKVVPIYGLVDLKQFRKDEKMRIQLDLNPPVFMYCGSYIQSHGVEIIFKAFLETQKEYQDCSLLLIGPVSKNIKDMYGEEVFGNQNIKFIPEIDNKELPCYLNSCDFWLGSFSSSPKSNRTARSAMSEAMATECIVITGDTDENRKIILNGINGFLVPPDNVNELIKIFKSVINDLNPSIGRKAREYAVKNFGKSTLESIVENQILVVKYQKKSIWRIKINLIILQIGVKVKELLLKT